MAKVKTIRALDRGLMVLEALKEHRAATLGDLHAATGLARATLLRLLKTLEDRSWIFHVPEKGIYRIGSRSHYELIANSLGIEIARLATPILDRLCKKILWPSGVAVRDGHTMLILETERQSSPFIVDRTIIGHRPSFLKSATGRAYLAFCPDQERKDLLDALRTTGHPDDNLANMPVIIDQIVRETRRNGYGVREIARRTRISDSEGSFNAIAVPVMARGRVVACINSLWIDHISSVKDFATAYLPALQEAARNLGLATIKTRLARTE